MVDVMYDPGDGGAVRDIALTVASGAVVADVARALTGSGQDVLIDGRAYDAGTPLSLIPVCRGSILRVGACAGAGTPAGSGAGAGVAGPGVVTELRVTGGLDAGHRFLLTAGSYAIGRSGTAAVEIALPGSTVSARHAILTVDAAGRCRVRDLGSRNGVRIDRSFVVAETSLQPDAVAEFGALQLTAGVATIDDRPLPKAPGPTGVMAFDRMPRTVEVTEPTLLRAPTAPAEAGHAARLSMATVLAPLAIAGLLYVLMPRNAMIVVFMAMSPLLAVATWAEDRRRLRKQHTRAQLRHQQALHGFGLQVQAACRAHLLRLRRLSPDMAEVIRRAHAPSAQLWERRPIHADFGSVRIGTADTSWRPPLEDQRQHNAEVAAVLAQHETLLLAPVDISLVSGRCLGIVGPRGASLSIARALVAQAVVHHGPADLVIAVLTQPARIPDWDWAKWLPHTGNGAGLRLLAGTPAEQQALTASLLRVPDDPVDGASRGPLHLAVMDAEGITAGRNCPPRELLQATRLPLAAIVLADRLDQLPDACTDVIEITHPNGLARYTETASGRLVGDVMLAGISASTARSLARALARYEDADLVEPGAGLPHAVPLSALFETAGLTAAGLQRRWSGRRTGALAAPIGTGPAGPLVVDLVSDGPHGLIAGTTGSGKSELLRTVVASLAVSYSPRDVTFLLIDYKGGSAFAECAKLPHTVGLVTDLDEHLGSRALTCLEAELRHRERVLRDAGAADLLEYIAAGETRGSLPRLIVAIDEFATLAAELPDFIDALVGVAQRGRSLGVHLLLATQRPRGAVKDNIRANSNLRIALRVQDVTDSTDVLDARDAAAISRSHPGRAFLRLGPGELVAFQSAYVSGTSLSAAADDAAVRVCSLAFGPNVYPPAPDAVAGASAAAGAGLAAEVGAVAARVADDVPTDLARIVEAARAAAEQMDLADPRRPWPDPLPAKLWLDDLLALDAPTGDLGADLPAGGDWGAPIGLADEPDRQRRVPYSWRSREGGLLLYGVAGSGTSTALATIALSLARRHAPTDLHLYALDFGTQLLAPLVALPHVGAVIGANERERQERLIRRLRREVTRRQDAFRISGAAGVGDHNARCEPEQRLPGIVLMLDNWSAFAAAFDDLPGLALRDELARVVADGPGLGIFTMITADRASAVPAATAGLISQRLVFRLSEPHDFGAFGIAVRELPAFVPGRAIDAATKREVHIALPDAQGVSAAVTAILAAAPGPCELDDVTDDSGPCGAVLRSGARLPARILTLPDDVSLADLEGVAKMTTEEWWLPFGIGDAALDCVALRLGEGDHVLIAGAPRSGKSTLLLVLARAAMGVSRPPRTIVIATARSPLRQLAGAQVFGVDDEKEAMQFALSNDAPCLLLVDDAERVDDSSGAISALIALHRPDDRVIAAGRADALRSSYGHWTQEVRRSRQGVVLKPNVDIDGDLWGMLLPRRGPVRFAAGRGYLVLDGEAELVQVARP